MADFSLIEALSEIALQEREWMEQGYCVGTLVKDPAHWALVGVYTRQDLEAYFAAEYAKEERKAAYCMDDDPEWIEYMERMDAEERRMEALHGWERPTAADIVANHYQEGWA